MIAMLSIALLVFPFFLFDAVTAADPPQPTYASANMNGDPSEWDLNVGGDFFAYMFRAGDPTKPVESNASLRYDCNTGIMYVLVMTVPGVPALVSPTDAWAAINSVSNKVYTGNSGNGSTPPAFVWVGQGYDGNSSHAQGYEAAFSIAPGNYTIIIHIAVDDGGKQTSATTGFPQTGVPLEIICNAAPAIDVNKMISTDNATWIDADTPPGLSVTAGSDVYYSYNVTNTGNVTLSEIALTDSLYFLGATPPATLAPDASYLFYLGPITAQIGQHTNTANATGTFNSTKYSDVDDANYNGTEVTNPAITVIKFVSSDNATWMDANTPPGLMLPAGDNVYYRYVVTNVGNVELFNISLTDNVYSLSVTPPASLLPNASVTYYYGPVTALVGQQTNTATAIGQYDNLNYTDTDDANYFGCDPGIVVTKLISNDNATWVDANSPPGLLVLAGSKVYYQYIVNNTGNVELTHLSLTDSSYTLSVVPPASLAVGETFSYFYGPVTTLIGQHTNTATASGRCISGTYYNATDDANYFGAIPSIQLVKSISVDNSTWFDVTAPPGITVAEGTDVYFKFEITNTGNVDLTNITLTDDTYTLTGLVLPSTLSPDEVFTYYLGPVTAQINQHTNNATTTGVTNNITYSDSHLSNYFGTGPSINVTKYVSSDNATWVDANTPPGLNVYVGSNVYYKYVVNNTGNVELFNITLTDDVYTLGAAPPMFLAANEEYTFYYGPVTALSGQQTNTASTTGQYYNETYADTDDANYYGSIEPIPGVSIVKQISTDNVTWVDADTPPGLEVLVGTNLYFRYVVNNTGTVPLENLTLTDNVYTLVPSLPATLEPNETYTYYYGAVLSLEGQHTNIATATGDYNGSTVDTTDEANYFGVNPSINVVKQISIDNVTWVDADTPPGLYVVTGLNIYYRFTVTNDGNVELANITLSDDTYDLSGAVIPSTLEPEESFVYYYGPVTAVEGQHTNVATSTGDYNGTTYDSTNSANYLASTMPCPAIDVTKWISADNMTWVDANSPPGLEVAAGSNVYFKFDINNTGNVELSNILLWDSSYILSGLVLPTTLAPNETFTYYYGPAIAQECQQTNLAIAIGKYGNYRVFDFDTANYYGIAAPNPSICIIKYVSTDNRHWCDANSAPGLIVPVNSSVYFKYIIRNTGNVALSNITFVDDPLYPNQTISGDLAPGETITIYLGTLQVAPLQNMNEGTISAMYDNVAYSDSDTAYYHGSFCTFTANEYRGKGTAGRLLNSYFSSAFPDGMQIGYYDDSSGHSYEWTRVSSLKSFLRCTGTSGPINYDRLNPTNVRCGGGSLAVQVATLSLNVALSEMSAKCMTPGFGDLVYVNNGDSLSGQTISQILATANNVLGGQPLPDGYTYSSLKILIQQLNDAFDCCKPSLWAQTYLTANQIL